MNQYIGHHQFLWTAFRQAELMMNKTERIPLKKPFALCGWLLLFCAAASAQTSVRSISFEGNSFFSQRQLSEFLPVRSGQTLVPVQGLVAALERAYRAEGFYGFTVDSTLLQYADDSTMADIIFYLSEHEQTVVSRITFSGNHAAASPVLSGMMETDIGSPFRPEVLESDIREILAWYSRNGFPFTAVSADSVRPDVGDVTKLIVDLIITEGPPVVLNEMRVEGNSVTSASVVMREARIPAGTLFDQTKADRAQKRLERVQLFASVSEPQLYVLPGGNGDTLRGGLLITVTEGNTNTFDGIVGYVPPVPPSRDGYVTGNVFIAMRNLFGTGRKALIKWQRETALTQELELQYKEPWLFGYPLSLGGSYQQRKQDSTFVRTRLEFRGEFAYSEELSFAGNVSTESVYPSSALQQFTVFRSSGLFVGAEVLYDTRDNLRNPTRGVRYATTAQQGTKRITGPDQYLHLAPERSFSVQKYSVDAEFYQLTFPRQVIMAGIHGKQISSSRLEQSDLYPLGGTTTLRGYRENQFFASQIAYINTEYRFLTGRASSFFGFLDAGYFSRPADALRNTPGQERSLYGFGAGARIETGLGIMNISYALGDGDSFSNGKIHVGIINEF